jgi:hypothetical protein
MVVNGPLVRRATADDGVTSGVRAERVVGGPALFGAAVRREGGRRDHLGLQVIMRHQDLVGDRAHGSRVVARARQRQDQGDQCGHRVILGRPDDLDGQALQGKADHGRSVTSRRIGNADLRSVCQRLRRQRLDPVQVAGEDSQRGASGQRGPVTACVAEVLGSVDEAAQFADPSRIADFDERRTAQLQPGGEQVGIVGQFGGVDEVRQERQPLRGSSGLPHRVVAGQQRSGSSPFVGRFLGQGDRALGRAEGRTSIRRLRVRIGMDELAGQGGVEP